MQVVCLENSTLVCFHRNRHVVHSCTLTNITQRSSPVGRTVALIWNSTKSIHYKNKMYTNLPLFSFMHSKTNLKCTKWTSFNLTGMWILANVTYALLWVPYIKANWLKSNTELLNILIHEKFNFHFAKVYVLVHDDSPTSCLSMQTISLQY